MQVKRKNERLELKFSMMNYIELLPEGYSFRGSLSVAYEYCNVKYEMFRIQCLTALFDIEKEENVEWNDTEKEAIIICMSKAIEDNSLTLSDKDKQVRADDCLTRIALVSWLTSQSGYKRERASSIEIYPSERTMYREQYVYAKLCCHNGKCPKTYGMYQDRVIELSITRK
mmetsp:Transcript_28645/g.51869  ORF Transcript_28645/g.51869 Transcript_28645/m.51869 type:complete len:171 (+) Transcript_28645:292-804(+)